MIWITAMRQSLTQSQTFWRVKSSRPQEALLRTKLVEVMKLQISYKKILKDDTVKVLPSIRYQTWKTQHWPQDWKRSVFIPIPKKVNAKECSNYSTNAFISCTSKIMLKILQASLQQYMNRELPDQQAGFRKGKRTRDTSTGSQIKQKHSRKTSIYFCFIDYAKLLTMWIKTSCGKFLK